MLVSAKKIRNRSRRIERKSARKKRKKKPRRKMSPLRCSSSSPQKCPGATLHPAWVPPPAKAAPLHIRRLGGCSLHGPAGSWVENATPQNSICMARAKNGLASMRMSSGLPSQPTYPTPPTCPPSHQATYPTPVTHPPTHLPYTYPTPVTHPPTHLPYTYPTPVTHLPSHLPYTYPTPVTHLPSHLPYTSPRPPPLHPPPHVSQTTYPTPHASHASKSRPPPNRPTLHRAPAKPKRPSSSGHHQHPPVSP
jgi:hypothetical protein